MPPTSARSHIIAVGVIFIMTRFRIFLILFIISNVSYAQIDYYKIRSKKLTAVQFDTVKTAFLVVEGKYARVYFRQSDLRNYIAADRAVVSNRPMTIKEWTYDNLYDLIDQGEHRIQLYDWGHSYTEQERIDMGKTVNHRMLESIIVNELFYIRPDLIYDGQFMIFDKTTSEFITKKMKIKRVRGVMGGYSLYFYLPDRNIFWYVVLSFGE